MKVIFPHPSTPWPDKRSASLPAFYCIIWVELPFLPAYSANLNLIERL